MRILPVLATISLLCLPTAAKADTACAGLPDHATLKQAVTKARLQVNGGLNLDMWGSVVDRTGRVCAVVYTGTDAGAQWPGSRLISAQKANTANAFSLDGLALSTANLFSPVQPGGSLFGLQDSNPINVPVAYNKAGNLDNFGTVKDPLVGEFIGGVNVFGGGLALYNKEGKVIGAVGVSGDTSCADHNIAWRTRHTLNLDFVPAGVSADKNDQIIFDIENGKSAGGFGHPACGEGVAAVAASLPKSSTIAKAAE
tara:strand:- start:1253 stop:2017 length:765 start_codon:yes stop_codon:yes gene_type:complete